MLTQRLIPSLLLKGGRLVKGTRFAGYRDAGLPATTARAHDAQGADELIVLDVDAAKEGRGPDADAIRAVAAECRMPLAVGGGVRSLADARACMAAGADKLSLNTGALDRPALIAELAETFGSQAVVLGIDVAGDAKASRLYDHRMGKADARDPLTWAREGVARGAGEVRITAVEREGTRQGMDLDLLRLFREAVDVPVVLEGGAGTLEHVRAAYDAGADGVALGTMLVFSDNNIVKIKRYLAGRGCRVRV